MSNQIQYMVDFSLPFTLTEEFFELIPKQRSKVGEYFANGKLSAYTLSMEISKLWAVINAEKEREVIDLIATFPLTKYMEFKIYPLTFHQTMENSVMTFSLN